jgi:hypothetical protein
MGLAVVDVGLETLEPVRSGPGEAVEIQDPATGEQLVGDFAGLQGPVELPPVVRRVEIVGGDEHPETALLRRLEDPFHVLHGLVLSDALPHERPRLALLIQDVVLRVDEHHRGVDPIQAMTRFPAYAHE